MRLEALGTSTRPYPGESFVVQWQDSVKAWPMTAVVDLGDSGCGLAAAAAAARPDVLVLTHADADHIGGWPEFRNAAVALPEVWLPSDWALVVQSVLAALGPDGGQPAAFDPREVSTQISGLRRSTRRCSCAAGQELRCDACLRAADRLRQALYRLREELNGSTREGFREGLRGALADRLAALESEYEGSLGPDAPGAVARDATKAKKIVSVVETVADCADEADVRWFLPRRHVQGGEELWRRTGEPGRLTVVNAVEVAGPSGWTPTAADALPVALALTTVNRRALALYAWAGATPPADDCEPFHPIGMGALITSDSRRPGGTRHPVASFPIPWEHVGMMTAPHHGSPDAEHSGWWEELPPGRSVVLSNNSQKTCADFFRLPPSLRSCTSCASGRRSTSSSTRTASSTQSGWSLADKCSNYCFP